MAEKYSVIWIISSIFFIIALNLKILSKNIISKYYIFELRERSTGPKVIKSIKKYSLR